MVARLLWEQDAAGSSPVTSTKNAVLSAKIQNRKGSPCGFCTIDVCDQKKINQKINL